MATMIRGSSGCGRSCAVASAWTARPCTARTFRSCPVRSPHSSPAGWRVRPERRDRECFSELAQLLYLRVCSDFWPGHIATLRDSVAVELLGARNHKSAVASHIRRCNEELSRFWEAVEGEFLSRLCTIPLAAVQEHPSLSVADAPNPQSSPVAVSRETERLLAHYASARDARWISDAESTENKAFPLSPSP